MRNRLVVTSIYIFSFMYFVASCAAEDISTKQIQAEPANKLEETPDPDRVIVAQIQIEVDRTLENWLDNKAVVEHSGVLSLPMSFEILSLTQNENGGWIDIMLLDAQQTMKAVYCYQGQVGKKQYIFKFEKTIGSTSGCDVQRDQRKDPSMFSLAMETGDVLIIVPRAPRLAELKVLFKFSYLGIIKDDQSLKLQ